MNPKPSVTKSEYQFAGKFITIYGCTDGGLNYLVDYDGLSYCIHMPDSKYNAPIAQVIHDILEEDDWKQLRDGSWVTINDQNTLCHVRINHSRKTVDYVVKNQNYPACFYVYWEDFKL